MTKFELIKEYKDVRAEIINIEDRIKKDESNNSSLVEDFIDQMIEDLFIRLVDIGDDIYSFITRIKFNIGDNSICLCALRDEILRIYENSMEGVGHLDENESYVKSTKLRMEAVKGINIFSYYNSEDDEGEDDIDLNKEMPFITLLEMYRRSLQHLYITLSYEDPKGEIEKKLYDIIDEYLMYYTNSVKKFISKNKISTSNIEFDQRYAKNEADEDILKLLKKYESELLEQINLN